MQKTKNKKTKIAILSDTLNSWANDLLFVDNECHIIYHLKDSTIDEIYNPNPYNLERIEDPDVVLLTSSWALALYRKNQSLLKKALNHLEKKKVRIVGYDITDTFALQMPALAFHYFSIIIKSQGVFKDKDLYNYKVGTEYYGANWDKKKKSKEFQLSNKDLDKIKLGPPCFISVHPEIRKKIRSVKHDIPYYKKFIRQIAYTIYSNSTVILQELIPAKKDIHFIGALTHYQRYELIKILNTLPYENTLGITNIPKYIFGQPNDKRELSAEDRIFLQNELIKESALISKRNRLKYLTEILKHKIVAAPCGYGELSFRMGEAMMLKRVLLCQNIDHVETMFPFKNKENLVYTKADFSDIEEAINYAKNNYKRISDQGFKDFDVWIKDYKKHIYNGIEKHIID